MEGGRGGGSVGWVVVRSKELTESGNKIDGDKKHTGGNGQSVAFKS